MGRTFELLNCDDHASVLKKQNKQPGDCRPDIVHQCLLMLLDSPLNRAGLLQVSEISVKSSSNYCIYNSYPAKTVGVHSYGEKCSD